MDPRRAGEIARTADQHVGGEAAVVGALAAVLFDPATELTVGHDQGIGEAALFVEGIAQTREAVGELGEQVVVLGELVGVVVKTANADLEHRNLDAGADHLRDRPALLAEVAGGKQFVAGVAGERRQGGQAALAGGIPAEFGFELGTRRDHRALDTQNMLKGRAAHCGRGLHVLHIAHEAEQIVHRQDVHPAARKWVRGRPRQDDALGSLGRGQRAGAGERALQPTRRPQRGGGRTAIPHIHAAKVAVALVGHAHAQRDRQFTVIPQPFEAPGAGSVHEVEVHPHAGAVGEGAEVSVRQIDGRALGPVGRIGPRHEGVEAVIAAVEFDQDEASSPSRGGAGPRAG